MYQTEQEFWQGIIESQLPNPEKEIMDELRLHLSFDLFECITDDEIITLIELVKFARKLKNDKPIF